MEHDLQFTNSGLASCQRCNGGEGTLALECPGYLLTEEFQTKILKREVEFARKIWWVPLKELDDLREKMKELKEDNAYLRRRLHDARGRRV